MKATQLSIIIACLSIGLSACKPTIDVDEVPPNPIAEVHFAYEAPGIFSDLGKAPLPIDTLKTFIHFGFVVNEDYLSNYYGFTTDSGVVEFNVSSINDQEVFNNRRGISNQGTWRSNFGSRYSFGGEVYVPFKISNIAIKGNDTLEIANTGDMIKASYSSKYTQLSSRDSIQIVQ